MGKKKTAWEDDLVQFARLLCEIRATCEFSNKAWLALSDSMDLHISQIESLFDRAQVQFDKSKEKYCPIRRNRG